MGFFQGAFALRQGLQAGHRQHAGNGGHGGFLAHSAQKVSALLVLWKQGLDQGGFNELLTVRFKFGSFGARTQSGCCSIGRNFCMVVGGGVIATAAAFEHQGTIGVIRIKELRHGNLFSVKTRGSMQATRQLLAGFDYLVN
jgi:hypothetical protein